jgi:hypothetical protein
MKPIMENWRRFVAEEETEQLEEGLAQKIFAGLALFAGLGGQAAAGDSIEFSPDKQQHMSSLFDTALEAGGNPVNMRLVKDTKDTFEELTADGELSRDEFASMSDSEQKMMLDILKIYNSKDSPQQDSPPQDSPEQGESSSNYELGEDGVHRFSVKSDYNDRFAQSKVRRGLVAQLQKDGLVGPDGVVKGLAVNYNQTNGQWVASWSPERADTASQMQQKMKSMQR